VPKNERVLEDYYDLYDGHPDRTLTQAWNVARVSRIMLCEEIISEAQLNPSGATAIESSKAETAAKQMIREICASAPQMVDCDVAARQRLSPHDNGPHHSHTQKHYLDAHAVIFGLYVAAWSSCCPAPTRVWIIKELERVADHLGIKQAATAAEALKNADTKGRTGPWEMYGLLGSYAFAA
jgi:hypothetical protein